MRKGARPSSSKRRNRLLVHDKLIAPMPEEQVAEKTVRHRLATWYARQLPDGDPLLK